MFTGHEVCSVMMGIRLHFIGEYDFHRYGGVNISYEKFLHRKDHWHCNKLSKKYPNRQKFIDFLSSVYANAEFPSKLYSSDFLTKKSEKLAEKTTDYVNDFANRFSSELENVFLFCKEQKVTPIHPEGELPLIYKFHRREPNLFSFESLCVFRRIVPFDENPYVDSFLYPDMKKKIDRFQLFLVSRIDNYYEIGRSILKEKITKHLTA